MPELSRNSLRQVCKNCRTSPRRVEEMNRISEYIEVQYRGVDYVFYTRLGQKLSDPRSSKWLRLADRLENIGSVVTPESSDDPIYTALIDNGAYSAAHACVKSAVRSLNPEQHAYLLEIIDIINYCYTRI